MIRIQTMSRENVNSDYGVTHILLLSIENDKIILISFDSFLGILHIKTKQNIPRIKNKLNFSGLQIK